MGRDRAEYRRTSSKRSNYERFWLILFLTKCGRRSYCKYVPKSGHLSGVMISGAIWYSLLVCNYYFFVFNFGLLFGCKKLSEEHGLRLGPLVSATYKWKVTHRRCWLMMLFSGLIMRIATIQCPSKSGFRWRPDTIWKVTNFFDYWNFNSYIFILWVFDWFAVVFRLLVSIFPWAYLLWIVLFENHDLWILLDSETWTSFFRISL